ncbi:hypothetical protein ILUMI_26462 [Ignelater luminosus]|uniref:Craniofacial development protein 2-like n=1 Tax=Ignelater luminosus TaxID=2038154 RepID=A0A8K0C8F4_IGNLU|nr:hypothetical protein ILUMI_26462 [Ignelater luminosus]
MDQINHKVTIVGDFNGRVGPSKENNYPIEPCGERERNSNGQRVIDFCIMNDMRASNTFFTDTHEIEKLLKEKIKEAKTHQWEEFGNKMERDSKGKAHVAAL